jgi:parallel beta-helix repeat protein
MRRVLVLVCLVCLGFVGAEDFFVAQSGGGDGSSASSPMSLGQYSSRSFGAGDVVYFCGTFTSRVVIDDSGSSEGNLTYSGLCPGGQRGVLDFNGNPMMSFSGQDYLVIEDFEIKNGEFGIHSAGSSDNVVIRRTHIYNMGGIGIGVARKAGFERNTNIIIGGALGDGNDIHDIGHDTGGSDMSLNHIDGFVVSYNELYGTDEYPDKGVDGMVLFYSTDGVIEYNDIHSHNGAGEDGMDLKDDNDGITVRYNKIHDHEYQSGVKVQLNTRNVYVYGNEIYSNNVGVLAYGGAKADSRCSDGKSTENVYVWGNVFYHNEWAGVAASSSVCNDGGIDPTNNVKVYNNVFYENEDGVRLGSGSGHEIKNNIFYKNDYHEFNGVQLKGSSSSAVLENNIFYWDGEENVIDWDGSDVVASSVGDGNFEDNPDFFDVQDFDFTLKDGSPAVDSGTVLDSKYFEILDSSTDWDSFPSPESIVMSEQGDDWEIGAYAYGGDESCLEFSDVIDALEEWKVNGNTGLLLGIVSEWMEC